MTESTELTKQVYKKLIKAGNKLIDYGETAYEENEFGALVAHRTPSKELLALVKVTTEAIAEAKLEWQSQLRKEIEGEKLKLRHKRHEKFTEYMRSCPACRYNQAADRLLNLPSLQETK
mgnify:CR=1 FL=1